MIQTKSQQRRSRFLMDIVFILISAVCVVPLLLIVSAAFTDEQALFRNGYQFWPVNSHWRRLSSYSRAPSRSSRPMV